MSMRVTGFRLPMNRILASKWQVSNLHLGQSIARGGCRGTQPAGWHSSDWKISCKSQFSTGCSCRVVDPAAHHEDLLVEARRVFPATGLSLWRSLSVPGHQHWTRNLSSADQREAGTFLGIDSARQALPLNRPRGGSCRIARGVQDVINPQRLVSGFATTAMASVASSPAAADAPIKSTLSGSGVAVLTLDRPRALNAMNLGMDEEYKRLLDAWAADPAVQAVLVEGGTPRAFCSGMDVKWTASVVKADPSSDLVPKVFAAEYVLICAISRLRKPYIALMDGITMGFGLGLSAHGRYRVITERTVMAMPENGIGLFPDVGFAHLVANSPGGGAVGAYLAMTGARINTPQDIIYCGLASHYVPSESIPALREEIVRMSFSTAANRSAESVVEEVLGRFAKPVEGEPQLKKLVPAIKRCFGHGISVQETVQGLQREMESSDSEVSAWAKQALAGVSKGAPFSLVVTQQHFASVASARAMTGDGISELAEIEGVMRAEYRLAMRTAFRPDFVEGVRAVLVDKDQKPKWQPATLEEVDISEVKGCFDLLEEEKELELP